MQVAELLNKGDFEALPKLFDENAESLRRHLTKLSYSANDDLKARAIHGFKVLSEHRAAENQKFFLEIIRRHVWGMNEEGGNNDWSAPEIIAAVIIGQPKLYIQFIPVMFYAAVVEPFFRPSLTVALNMLEEAMPGSTGELIEEMNSTTY